MVYVTWYKCWYTGYKYMPVLGKISNSHQGRRNNRNYQTLTYGLCNLVQICADVWIYKHMLVLGNTAISHQDRRNIFEYTSTLTYGLCILVHVCADVRPLAHACAGKHGHFIASQKEYKGRYWYVYIWFMLPGTSVCWYETISTCLCWETWPFHIKTEGI